MDHLQSERTEGWPTVGNKPRRAACTRKAQADSCRHQRSPKGQTRRSGCPCSPPGCTCRRPQRRRSGSWAQCLRCSRQGGADSGAAAATEAAGLAATVAARATAAEA
eukprot:scaffold49823_cov55-Phaeocystis_antarctica.AAC.2